MGIILALTKIDYNDKDITIHGGYRRTYFSNFKFIHKIKELKEIEDIKIMTDEEQKFFKY